MDDGAFSNEDTPFLHRALVSMQMPLWRLLKPLLSLVYVFLKCPRPHSINLCLTSQGIGWPRIGMIFTHQISGFYLTQQKQIICSVVEKEINTKTPSVIEEMEDVNKSHLVKACSLLWTRRRSRRLALRLLVTRNVKFQQLLISFSLFFP